MRMPRYPRGKGPNHLTGPVRLGVLGMLWPLPTSSHLSLQALHLPQRGPVHNTAALSVFPGPLTLSQGQADAVLTLPHHCTNSRSALNPQLRVNPAGESRTEASPVSTPQVRPPCYKFPQQLFILLPVRRALRILHVFTVVCLTLIFGLMQAGTSRRCLPLYPWQVFEGDPLTD